MKRLAVLALLAACSKEGDMFPLNPGGGGGTGSQYRPDAAMSPDDASSLITGRVCFLLANLHTLTSCATSGAGEFTVRLGSAMVQTADDGSFTLMRPASTTGLTWLVSRGDAITSAIKFGATTTLPVLDANAYSDMIVATQPALVDGSGALMVRVTRAGAPVQGATIATTPPPDAPTIYYDGPNELAWETDATGSQGVAWLPSVPVGATQITITAGTAMPAMVTGHTIFADTLTIAFAELP